MAIGCIQNDYMSSPFGLRAIEHMHKAHSFDGKQGYWVYYPHGL